MYCIGQVVGWLYDGRSKSFVGGLVFGDWLPYLCGLTSDQDYRH